MIVRDIVTSNIPFSPDQVCPIVLLCVHLLSFPFLLSHATLLISISFTQLPPKEIAVISSASHKMGWLDISQLGYFQAPSKISVEDVEGRSTPLRSDLEGASPTSKAHDQQLQQDSLLEHMNSATRYQHHNHQRQHTQVIDSEEAASDCPAPRSQSPGRALQASSSPAKTGNRQSSTNSTTTAAAASYMSQQQKLNTTPVTPQTKRQRAIEPDTPDLINMEIEAPQTVADDGKDSSIQHSRYKEKKISQPSRSRLAISKVTPRRIGGVFGAAGKSSAASTTSSVIHSGAKILSGAIFAIKLIKSEYLTFMGGDYGCGFLQALSL